MANDNFSATPGIIFGTLAAGALVKLTFVAIARWKKKRDFELVGNVSALNLFPVKSCGGFSAESGECTQIGLCVQGVTDRHWVVCDSNYNILDQNQIPKLAIVKVLLEGESLVINAFGIPALKVPTRPVLNPSNVVTCKTSKGQLEGLDCGDEAAQWFSTLSQKEGVRLLHAAPGLKKRDISLEERSWGNPALPGDPAAFSDFSAYHVMPESSMRELNDRMEKPTSIMSFRPTIIVSGTKAFDEDNWQLIRIGDNAVLRCLYPCPRCIKVNVNQRTGERLKISEPLEALRKFRCFPLYGRSPIFGVSAALDTPGPVRLGDPIYILRK